MIDQVRLTVHETVARFCVSITCEFVAAQTVVVTKRSLRQGRTVDKQVLEELATELRQRIYGDVLKAVDIEMAETLKNQHLYSDDLLLFALKQLKRVRETVPSVKEFEDVIKGAYENEINKVRD